MRALDLVVDLTIKSHAIDCLTIEWGQRTWLERGRVRVWHGLEGKCLLYAQSYSEIVCVGCAQHIRTQQNIAPFVGCP